MNEKNKLKFVDNILSKNKDNIVATKLMLKIKLIEYQESL